MKATGIVRRIDDLGRIVIPKEIRRTLRIHEGDPLEIYTDSDGMVIFKKYSPIGELSEFAHQYADTLNKSTGLLTCITDKDSVIAASGNGKKELKEKKVSGEVEKMVSCEFCEVYVPVSEAVERSGKIFCSHEHSVAYFARKRSS